MQTAKQQNSPSELRRPALLPFLIVCAVIIAFGAALRWYHIGTQSLWFDEGYSAWVVSLPVDQVVSVIRADVSPPLYYLALKPWTQIAGDSEAGLRSLSALAACLAIPLLGATAWRITASRAATLVAMLVMAFSVLQIQFAQEARSYGIASFLALIAFYAVVRSAGGAGWWLLLGWLASTACVYMHNMMWFFLASLNLAYLLMPGAGSLRHRIAQMTAVDVGVVAAYAWWIPELLGQMRWLHGNFWAAVPGLPDLAQVLVAASGMKLMHLSSVLYQWTALFAGVVLFLICALPLVARSREQFRWAAAVLVYGMLPILAVFAHAHVNQSFFLEKVFTASTIAVPLLAGLAWTARLRILAVPVLAAFLAGSALSVWGYFNWEQKEDWRAATSYINRIQRDGTLVVFVANEGELLYRYYTQQAGGALQDLTGAPHSFLDLNPPRTIQRVQSEQDLAALSSILDARKPARIILVLSHADFSDPRSLTRGLIAARMRWLSDQPFHLLRVEVYEQQGRK